jgi:mannose-6-phosphate isomerase class I
MIDLKRTRETSQFELPIIKTKSPGKYDIYPTHEIGNNLIYQGYNTLASVMASSKIIKIDGYVGIKFGDIKENLNAEFLKIGIQPKWVNVESALKEEKEIDELIAPYLGGNDPVFGKLCDLEIKDFYQQGMLNSLSKLTSDSPIIFYGIGADLVPTEGKTVFFEISKNEIQYRSRAGSILNLGSSVSENPQDMYKRFYFVDWPVLNNHKKNLVPKIDFLVDGQRAEDITWTGGDDWRKSIGSIINAPIRVRPWFSPGAWGGQWMKDKIDGLAENVVNYAWSFELIVPENGVILESSGLMLEFSFDFLMFQAGKEILGQDFSTYKYEFPIRFDFLDTVEGGNLSIQCHPQKEYMKKYFGENITQEETYYILDKKEGASVYLGFQKDVTAAQFGEALKTSASESKGIEINQFVQEFESEKHELYLIPPGTIHSAGKNNLILEISSTPYIYTFKLYDWLRLGLDGNPRPLNIDRGMDNLVFDRAGAKVKEELISKSIVLQSGEQYSLEHLPTHKEHFYDVHRYTINTSVKVNTSGKVHVLNLVEGEAVQIITQDSSAIYYYAETFIIPAAVIEYTIKNLGKSPIKVLKAFIK